MHPLTITAQTLRTLTTCTRQVWLDDHADPQARNPLRPEVRLSLARGVWHEDGVQAAVMGPTTTIPVFSWDEAVSATRDLMRQGVSAIRGAALEHDLPGTRPVRLRGQVDWLLRVEGASDLGHWHYAPVEIKRYDEADEADRLQLDLYLLLVRAAQGREVSGWFWLGQGPDGGPRVQIEHVLRQEHLLEQLKKAAQTLDDADAPPVFLASHCKTCHWLRQCTETAEQERSFTLLPLLHQRTRAQMWAAGLRTLDDLLALTNEDLLGFHGIGPKTVHTIRAYVESFAFNQPQWHAPLPAELCLPGIMFDLETRLDDGRPWCWGWQVAGEPLQVVIVDTYCDPGIMTLPDATTVQVVNGIDEAWVMLAEAAERVPGLICHWTNYDLGILRQSAPRAIVTALESRMHDLHHTFKATVTLPIRSTSIKVVGDYLGYRWPPESNAFAAFADYERWLLDGDALALARACAYQRADVEALAIVLDWLGQGTER